MQRASRQDQGQLDAQSRKRPKRLGSDRTSRCTASMSSCCDPSQGSSQSITTSDTASQQSLHTIDANVSALSLRPRSPSFSSPQTALPKSDEEQVLSQELALCDFRTYLLVMEAQNRERLRQARASECVCYEAGMNPTHQHPHTRDCQMTAQAYELQQRRMELQTQLEQLTGREYPMPEIYIQARQGPARFRSVSYPDHLFHLSKD
jgi:hypothetical protein